MHVLRTIFEPWEQHPSMLRAYFRARSGPGGDRLIQRGVDAVVPVARSVLARVDAAYAKDLELILTGVVFGFLDRSRASALASGLALLEAEHGDTVSAFDHLTLAIRNYHNCGNTTTIRIPLAVLAVLFDRLGRYEPAATVAGFALSPFSAVGVPQLSTAITHLRDVLGEATYESLARKGETMTPAATATYAYNQIDQARAELNAVSK
jgi:Tetracyclin repressor-like, C-terminal domain